MPSKYKYHSQETKDQAITKAFQKARKTLSSLFSEDFVQFCAKSGNYTEDEIQAIRAKFVGDSSND